MFAEHYRLEVLWTIFFREMILEEALRPIRSTITVW